jgi:hypothetical protein
LRIVAVVALWIAWKCGNHAAVSRCAAAKTAGGVSSSELCGRTSL